VEVITHMHILINIFGRKAYVKKIKIKPNWNSMVLSCQACRNCKCPEKI